MERNKYKTPETLKAIKSGWGEEKKIEFKKITDEFGKKGLKSVLIEYGWADEEINTIATIYRDFTQDFLAIVFVELGDTTYLKVMDYITITIRYYGLNFNNVDTNYKSEAYKMKK